MKKKLAMVLTGMVLTMGMATAYADSDNNGPENVEQSRTFQEYLNATGQSSDNGIVNTHQIN